MILSSLIDIWHLKHMNRVKQILSQLRLLPNRTSRFVYEKHPRDAFKEVNFCGARGGLDGFQVLFESFCEPKYSKKI